MKFSEKLSNLRRNNNMSQEQLADKLGVSRQAVSKWESGSSIPDMEKMMQLCKFLNCNLEDLVDDGVTCNSKKEELKGTWRDYYQEFLDFITKTLNMFWSMRFVEKLKCILEMLFIILLLWLVWAIIGNILFSSFYPILSLLPNVVYRIIMSISSFVYKTFGIIAGFVLAIHIFKIRYLDYFITIEDREVKTKQKEEPIEENQKSIKEEERKFIEKKKNTIIIRDPKHSTYHFFGLLTKIVVLFIKFLFILFAIPCIICFIGLVFMECCSFVFLKDGIFFLGILIALLGGILMNYLVLKVIYHFVFNLNIPFKKIFLYLVLGLSCIGIGLGISFCTYLTFDKLEEVPREEITTTRELDMQEHLVLSWIGHENVQFISDDSLSNIVIEIKHNPLIEPSLSCSRNYVYWTEELEEKVEYYTDCSLDFYYHDDFFDEMNQLLDRIRNKKRVDVLEEDSYQITISASSDTIKILKENYQKYEESY